MKAQISIPIIIGLIFANLDGGIVLSQRTPTAQNTEQPIAQMIESRGSVEVRKHGQSNYRTARVGETLFMGDLVRVAKGSRAVVRCTSNLTTWRVPDDGVAWGVANTCSPRRR